MAGGCGIMTDYTYRKWQWHCKVPLPHCSHCSEVLEDSFYCELFYHLHSLYCTRSIRSSHSTLYYHREKNSLVQLACHSYGCCNAVADLGGANPPPPPLVSSNIFCWTSPSNYYAAVAHSNNNQAQLHTHVPVPYWSPDVWLSLVWVASRYSVQTSSKQLK